MTVIRACGEVRNGLEKLVPLVVPVKKVVEECGGGVGRGRNGLWMNRRQCKYDIYLYVELIN